MNSTDNRQEELYDLFKQLSGLSADSLEIFRDCIVATEYCNQKIENLDSWRDDLDPCDLDIGVKHYKADGSEYTLADVPLRSLIEAIEGHIHIFVPEHRRTEVYKAVVEGVHGIRQTPKWDRRVDNPRAKARTLCSESKAPLESRITNEELFQSFVTTSKLDRKTLARIRGMIVWRDSARSNGTWGAIEWDTFEVTGGRLGPTEQHILADVPHCYVRDCLMVSTSIDIDPDRRDQVREVVFSDLTSSQIKHYAAEIEEIEAIEELERQLECHRSAKTKKPRRSQEVLDRTQKVREIQLRRKICPQEAECIMKQEEILDAVVDTIDLVPNPSFAARKMRCSKVKLCGRAWSVLKPGHLAQDDHEVLVPRECHIDRDCDQVRAMIKILVRRGHWTMEDFTKALDGSGRPEVNQFLEKRGPLQGKQSAVFQRSWDFFKKRELLGLELTAPPPKPKLAREIRALRGLQEVNPNRGYKRPSVESSEKPAKLQKR